MQEERIDIGSQKTQELFFYLLLFQDRPHPREKLADLLWPDSSGSQSKQYLRQSLSQLNSSFSREFGKQNRVVLAEPEWLQINPKIDISFDVVEFNRCIKECEGKRGSDLSEVQAESLSDAISVYSNDFLENWYQDWVILEREFLQNLYLDSLHKLMAYAERKGEYDRGIHYGSLILRCDPVREKAHRRMMRLRFLLGDRTGAIQQYVKCSELLGHHLDVEPSMKTQAVYTSIKDGFSGDQDFAENAGGNLSLGKRGDIVSAFEYINQLQETVKHAQLKIERELERAKKLINI